MAEDFATRLGQRVEQVGAPICVGLDPHLELVPGTSSGGSPTQNAAAIRAFSESVIDAVADVAAVLKPQVAFFEALGSAGWAELEHAVAYARAAGILVLVDAKRGDIGSTAKAYAHAFLNESGPLNADAVTVSPYLGPESMGPFLDQAAHKGIFCLLRTSNPHAEQWQHPVADAIGSWIGEHPGRVGAVVGSTLPVDEAQAWRERLPHTWFLVPGYGAQGGSVDALRPFFPSRRSLVMTARAVLFAGEGRAATIRDRARSFRDAVLSVAT